MNETLSLKIGSKLMMFRSLKTYFVFSFFTPVLVFAVPKPTDSWKTLYLNPFVKIQQSPLAEAFGPMGFFNACIKKDQFQTIKPLSQCLKWEQVAMGNETAPQPAQCLQLKETHVTLPIFKTEEVCVQWSKASKNKLNVVDTNPQCLEYKQLKIGLSTEPEFHVFYTPPTHDSNEGVGAPLAKTVMFKKKFQILPCGQ